MSNTNVRKDMRFCIKCGNKFNVDVFYSHYQNCEGKKVLEKPAKVEKPEPVKTEKKTKRKAKADKTAMDSAE